MVVQPTADLKVGRFISAGAARGGVGLEPPTCRFVVGCFTTRPLRVQQ